MDAATGAITQHRRVAPGEDRPVAPAVRTADGRLVVTLARADDGTGPGACGARLGFARGLDVAPLGEVPATRFNDPGLVAAPGSLLAAGSTGCDPGGPSGLWSVDLATGAVDVVLPAVGGPDVPIGLVSWTAGR